ncbi:MAG: NADH-quinone oxidoreductase subunit J [Firmicutes bacterium]|nr:NADH-quinone oxidoreductase subunit J [Bacillota bacterium]
MLFGIPITGQTISYFVLALIIMISGVMLMSLNKVMHMAVALGGVFLGVAGIFILLGADFVGMVQILIYAGAITILMVFALMLTQRGDDTASPSANGWRTAGVLVFVVLLCGAFLLVLRGTTWPVSQSAVNPYSQPTVNLIANALFHAYTVPFELVSLLLTVALVGAVVIARKEEE